MPELPLFQWILWIAVLFGQIALVAQMLLAHSWRRWPALFSFLSVLAAKDIIRVANALTARNPFIDFWTFWTASFVAEAVEVWLIVEIAWAAAGISRRVRVAVANCIVLMAAVCVTVSSAPIIGSGIPCWRGICILATRLDSAAAIAWLGTFVVVASAANWIATWPAGARGILIGLSVELTSSSYLTWIASRHGQQSATVATIKSLLYLLSLIIWAGSTGRPVTSPEIAENEASKRLFDLDLYRRSERSVEDSLK